MSLFAAALTVGAGLLLQKIAREAERVEQENRDAMQVDEQFDATIEASSSIASGSLDPNLVGAGHASPYLNSHPHS
ncbi:hypothetical protein FRB97_006385 [Tulasnella sp. 331]|nr:hypothetical protein FRB97_006385 [Tulasnella sp. 331]KAG8889107.1 hypothetical protein FRB98_005722 [Tulasnella sp. 332]